MTRSVSVLGALVALVHCGEPGSSRGSSEPDPDPDAPAAQTPKPASGARAPDAGADAQQAPTEARTCGPGEGPGGVPTLPMKFVELPSGATPPVDFVGGDPTGMWRVTAATVYVPTALAVAFDLDKTTGRLSGWAEFRGESARMQVRGEATGVAFDRAVPIHAEYNDRGKLEITGATATITWACPPDGGTPRDHIPFAVRGDRATLLSTISSSVGDVYLVLEASRSVRSD